MREMLAWKSMLKMMREGSTTISLSGIRRRFGLTLMSLSLLGLGFGVILEGPSSAKAQGRQKPPPVSMDVGDEPGRVATAEQTIEDGPFARQMVFFRSNEAPGTIVIHTSERMLYVVQGNHRALRYGIGVGREGFQWSGLVQVSRKAEWPDWTPPPEMIARQPYLPRFMAGGPGNPMGARALYLGSTVYRIHGTNQPETIGHAVSSGCFRLANGDVIDLFERIAVGAKVIIRHGASI